LLIQFQISGIPLIQFTSFCEIGLGFESDRKA
jgi:hypothetical protein